MKPKLKVVIKTKTSSCEVDLVTNRANTAFLWVVNTIWTDERPTEPGEYWLSLCPDRRRPGADVERVTISIVERRKVAQTCRPGWTYIDAGPPRQSLNVIIFDDDLLTNYFDLRAAAFDGAKWSRRETPADPFEEG